MLSLSPTKSKTKAGREASAMKTANFMPDDEPSPELEQMIEVEREKHYELMTADDALEQTSPRSASRSAIPPLKLIHANDIEACTSNEDLVEGLLSMSSTSVIYGPSNTGKSFWVLDLGAAVAKGAPFLGTMETSQGVVVYVALEGERGAKNRIKALMLANKLSPDSPFYFCSGGISLLDQTSVEAVVQTIRKASGLAGMKCKLVIIDTLARAMPGGSENEGRDMGLFIRAIDQIRQDTGAHVAVVHHSGKNPENGARGHSSLRAAVDTEIRISRQEGSETSTVEITKQRDMEAVNRSAFCLTKVSLGHDVRGREITSCVVQMADLPAESIVKSRGRKPKCGPEDLLTLLPQSSVDDWMGAARSVLGIGKTLFSEIKKQLVENGLAKQNPDSGEWIRADD